MKRFLFPTELYSGPGCIKELSRFIGENDKVALITDVQLVKLGLAEKIENNDIYLHNKIGMKSFHYLN